MAFWWVNHKQTYRSEIDGGYIWSPKANRNGARNETYINLTKTGIADVVFSYAFGKINAVGFVKGAYADRGRPSSFGSAGSQWSADGWNVPIDWLELNNGLSPKNHLDKIRPLLPSRYSPIQKLSGDGNQGCYLAAISDALGVLLFQMLVAKNPDLSDRMEVMQESGEEARIESSNLPPTDKVQLVKARRGQGMFRQRLEVIEKKCRVTQTSDKRFLVASHIKPWRLSSDAEKLDGNNGLLLAPHVDRLFDRGWISFSDEGEILCHDEDIKAIMVLWGMKHGCDVGCFNSTQKGYLAFHRENIYGKGSPVTES